MNDKTLGEYKRTTPDPDETTGEALARLQAELTRLLDEADAELRDEADGGVTAALIEQEDGVDAAASRLAAFARKFGVPPEWTTAPAVQAWHRSDHRTDHDGTPGQPRIWSPDYKTTETWSTPSLRNVHWSDLVDVTPLAPVLECPDPERHALQEPTDAARIIDEHRTTGRWVGDGVRVECTCGHISPGSHPGGPQTDEDNAHRDADRKHAAHVADMIARAARRDGADR